ncbi:MAG: sulfite exporter TauE/SafE family protein [Verrucomicrobia bacterium]|nr:sulfite exporter TauE/SafE family protein [Verrucomicrobiota bacterium]
MSLELIFILFILIGLVTGILSGMLGIGGGMISVPALYYLLQFADVAPDRLMQIAVSTSLAATFITTFVAWVSHHRRKSVLYQPVKYLLPGLLIGCVAGTILAQWMPSTTLRVVFGCMGICLGAYFLFPKMPHPNISHSINSSLSFFGLIIGTLSSLLGIGGGIFTVPLLLGYHVPMPNAIGSSSAATLLTALFGTVSYLIIAWHSAPLPYTFGYIQLPALFAIATGSICTAPLGVHLAHRLPIPRIKQIFGTAVILTGSAMLFR